MKERRILQKKTDNFLDKIVKKDYNNELEIILEKKYFEENVKSLLLSMLYKIEAAYKDYEYTKREVLPKEEFIQEIILTIKNECDEIKIVSPNSEEKTIIGDKTFLVEKNKKRIICYPIERKMLYSIAKIGKNERIIKDKYFLINETLSNLINVGNNINMVEPLRDFNGYSWTTIPREIESISHNLIYQNLNLLLGNKFLNKWIKNKQYIIDYMELFETRMQKSYGKENKTKFIELLKKLSILLNIKFDQKFKEKLIRKKEKLEKELESVQDNKTFIKEKTEEKKKIVKEIKYIDETINNKEALQQEYIKRNAELPIEKKIFSRRILSQMMVEEREKKLEQIERLNKILIPQNFIKYKKELEQMYKYLELVDVESVDKEIENFEIKLQKVFLKCFETIVKNAQTKQDIINLIYKYRYYCVLPFNFNKSVYQLEKLEKDIRIVGKKIIKKAHELKVIETISSDEEIDYMILENIFKVRIIELEDLYIKIAKEKDKFILQLFDENATEEKKELENLGNINKKALKIKINKKIKLFN